MNRRPPSPTGATVDPLAFLAGRWSVQRTVDAPAMRFSGTARIAPGVQAPGGLVWRETGRLTIGEHVGDARRVYLLFPDGAGAAAVRFDDGRPFHRLSFDDAGRCAAEHPCAADRYAGIYEVEDEERFTITWRVTGPTKDATIVSRYERDGVFD